jgi:hypothetical protein
MPKRIMIFYGIFSSSASTPIRLFNDWAIEVRMKEESHPGEFGRVGCV